MNNKLRKSLSRKAALALTAALVCTAAGTAASAAGSSGQPKTLRAGYAAESLQAAQAAAHDSYQIVALGDSLTAGYEYGMTEASVPYGYVDRVYEQALFHGRSALANYGIIGLKSEGLARLLGAVQLGSTITSDEIQPALPDPRADQLASESAEIRASVEQADLVVITIGGNDFWAGFDKLKNSTSAETAAWLQDTLDQYEKSLDASISALLAIQSDAEIVIADQYSPIPNSALLHVSEETYNALWADADMLRERLDKVVKLYKDQGKNVRAAYAAESFKGQEQNLTTIIASKGEDIHPNQKGYALIGDAFTKSIWGASQKVADRPKGVPISVVVNGNEVITPFKPILKDNRTYLVLRDITDAMKADTRWDGKTQSATITLDGRKVVLTIGSSTMTVDGKSIAIDTPAFLQKSGSEMKTFVPLAVLADGLGFQVVYRSPLKTAFINR